MKLILNNEIELDVLSSTEIKELTTNQWVLTIEAKGAIETQQIDNIIQDKTFKAILQDDNNEEKDLSTYELIGNIRILYGTSFNDNTIRIRLQSKGE